MKPLFSPFLFLLGLFLFSPAFLYAEVPVPHDLLAEIEATGKYAPLFPFVIGPETPENVTNVAFMEPNPAVSSISVRNGKFTDASGNPRHFLATNICFGGGFPEHEGAERTAKRLARLGINLVRLHYVHHNFPPGKKYPEKDSFIEPVQLEKFDYLFSELKKNGIYVYFQLNIARKFGAENGFENADRLPWYNNGLDNYEPRMIQLQKKFISQILEHVNPYTKTAYRDEPAIAMMELANENSILTNWLSPKMDGLPEPYVSQLAEKWNAWLEKKYGTEAKVREAWIVTGMEKGREFIVGEKNLEENWGIQNDAQSVGSWEWETTKKQKPVWRVKIEKKGLTPNMPQFFRAGLAVEANRFYTVSFRVRANRETKFAVRLSQYHDPWGVVGPRMEYPVTTEWVRKEYSFRSQLTDPNVRLVFADFEPETTLEFRDVSFSEGVEPESLGLASAKASVSGEVTAQSSLKAPLSGGLAAQQPGGSGGNSQFHFPLVTRDRLDLIPRQTRDFLNFLADVEREYFITLLAHTRETVACAHPVATTQASYGLRSTHALGDFCDAHSYWQHPVFPNSAWNAKDWYLRNVPMVNDPEHANLAHLAAYRVLGKPFTVSEYDHPFPNLYGAEGLVMLAAFGALQDWDAIFNFAWAHDARDVRDVVPAMFDLCSNSVKLAHLPACRNLFIRGDVHRGPVGRIQEIPLPEALDRELYAMHQTAYLHSSRGLPWNRQLANVLYTGLRTDVNADAWDRLGSWKRQTDFDSAPQLGGPQFGWLRSESREIYWNFEQKDAAYFQVDTPQTAALTGFTRGRTFDFRAFSLTPGETRLDWLTFTLTRMSGDGPGEVARLASGRWLLAATGLVQNTGMKLIDLKERDRVSIAEKNGGSYGTAPELCEGIPARLVLKDLKAENVTVWALNSEGNRQARPLTVTQEEKNVVLHLDPKHKTLWYEIEVKP